MIKGLQMAGSNPTKAAVIKNLRSLKSYNANGLLPYNLNYTNNFGHDPAQTCAWVMKAGPTGLHGDFVEALVREGPGRGRRRRADLPEVSGTVDPVAPRTTRSGGPHHRR